MGVVRYLAPDTDAYVASVQRHAAEFEARTGHRLEVRVLPRPRLRTRSGELVPMSGLHDPDGRHLD